MNLVQQLFARGILLIGTVSANERSVLLYVHMFLKNIKKI
jgi:hypothetical protein